MEQTNEARAEDKPAYSMPRKEDEAARQQNQENKSEVKPPKEPDKPKKELTEEQRQKQKKLIVYPLMFIIFAIVMWLIFAPSEKEEEQGQSGFNTDVPAPADNALVGDKQAATSRICSTANRMSVGNRCRIWRRCSVRGKSRRKKCRHSTNRRSNRKVATLAAEVHDRKKPSMPPPMLTGT